MNFEIHRYYQVDSTNVVAASFAKTGAPEGVVICAETQNGGHGRRQRVWNSPLGGLWFSMVLRPRINPRFAAQITLLTGVVVAKTLRRLYQTDKIRIKWPNDILLDDSKVAGILAEMQLDETGEIDYIIVGIGVDVAPDQREFNGALKDDIASLNFIMGKNFTCEEILAAILKDFSQVYPLWQIQGANVILPDWRTMNATLGNKIDVQDDDKIIFSGLAESITEEGGLVVRDIHGHAESFDFGEISIRRAT